MNTDKLSRILAILALLISLAALAVSGLGLLETRNQNRLVMLPRLQLDRNFDRPTKRGGLYLDNSGSGPATIVSFSLMGVELKDAAAKIALRSLIDKKINDVTFPTCKHRIKLGTFTVNDMVESGAHHAILEISDIDFTKKAEEKEWNNFQTLLDDVRVHVRYRSNHGVETTTEWP
jgi:hypothetical protein